MNFRTLPLTLPLMEKKPGTPTEPVYALPSCLIARAWPVVGGNLLS